MAMNRVTSVCRGCLAADRKMTSATLYEAEFKDLTGITISPSDGLPQWLCYECIALLQKCVRFGNKVMKSHYTLCKYVLESVPFTGDKDHRPYLSRSSILHYNVPGTQTKQPEDPIENSAVSDIDMPIITKIESVQDKDEVVSCIFKDDITAEECREQNHHKMNVVRTYSCSRRVFTKEKRLVPLNDEKQTLQGEVLKQISTGVDDIDSKTVEIKIEPSAADCDNITVEEWCVDLPNERYRLKQEEQTEQEQPVREVVRAGTCAARHSVRAREHLLDHNYISSTSHKQVDGEDVKSNVNSDDSVNGNSCSNVKLYICDICNNCFSNKRILITHIRGHLKRKPCKSSSDKKFKCDLCTISFKHKSKIIMHMRKHTGEKPYPCDVCMKRFAYKSALYVHMRIHTGEKPYKCDVCEKSFPQRFHRINHMLKHAGVQLYKCNVCHKGFTLKRAHDNHIRLHTGDKYKCDICPKAYVTKASLQKHILVHTGDKPYKCDVCMKCFVHSSNLKAHIRIHNGEKPYKCDVCMKRFGYRITLRNHMRLHTGETPYNCNICNEAFVSRTKLRTHIYKHTGERPFKCDVCDKTFTRKNDCNVHMRIHTDEKPFECEVCLKTFRRRQQLYAHCRKVCYVSIN